MMTMSKALSTGQAKDYYQQEFTNPADGARYTRTGFFCALKLEPYSAGVVLPHEETRAKAKEDRLRLMRAMQANPATVREIEFVPDLVRVDPQLAAVPFP